MTTLRQAGYNERRCIARDINGCYGWIITVGRYEPPADFQQAEWQQHLTQAVSQCIRWHPALSCCVKESHSAKPSIARLESFDLECHIKMLPSVTSEDDTAAITSLLEQAHAEPFTEYETRPQWYVWCQPLNLENQTTSYNVAFACSHVLLDGMSATFFHRTLDRALTGRLAPSTRTTLLPSLDQAVKLPISWSFLLMPLLQEKLPSSVARLLGIKQESSVWHGVSQRPQLQGELVKTAVRVVLYPSERLWQVLRACRLHTSKLTALLNMLVAKSLANALATEGQPCTAYRSSVPYDLRRLIDGSADQMANYSSATQGEVVVDGRAASPLSVEEWNTVAQGTALLQACSNTLSDQLIALLRYLSDFNEWVTRKATTPSGESYGVSNLGNFTPDGADSWLTQLVFSQSADATNSPLSVNVSSFQGGPLNIVLTWWPGMMGVVDEQIFIDHVCQHLTAWLDAVASESGSG